MQKTKKAISILLTLVMLLIVPTPVFAVTQIGDVNGDGNITAEDARLILRTAVGLEKDTNTVTADLDYDGKVTASDARLALRIAVGLDEAPAKKENGKPQTFTLSSESEDTMCVEIPIDQTLMEKYNFDGNNSITFSLPLSAFDGTKTLTVTQINELPSLFSASENAVIYDFEIDGVTELNGQAEIKIPLYFHSGSTTFGAAYYNEETKAWEPVNYYKDSDFLYIRTDHLSTYGMFEIENENLTTAILGDYILPQDSYSFDTDTNLEYLKQSSEKGSSLAALGDSMASIYSDASLFGSDIGYNTVNAMGFESTFMTKYSQLLSDVGFCFSCYQIARYHFEGDSAKVAGNSLQAIGSYWVGKAASTIGTSAMAASMAAVAALNFSIQSFGEAAKSGRKDIYSDAFNLYYSESNHKRSAVDWYKKLYPIFKNGNLTAEEIDKQVREEIDNYCNEFFKDGSVISTYVLKAREKFGYTAFGGYSKEIEKELSNNLKYELVNGVLKSVFQNISEKMEQKSWETMDKKMQEFRDFLNQTVTISLYDSGAKPSSEFAGGKATFTADTGYFKDADKLCCTLSNSGTGKISFTLISYILSGLSPLITVKTEKSSKTVSFKIKVPTTKVDLKGAKDLTGYWVKTGTSIVKGNDTLTDVYKDSYSANETTHTHKASCISDTKNIQSCTFTSTCEAPPSKIKGGETVSLNITCNISDSNVKDYHFLGQAWVFADAPDVSMGSARYNFKFTDKNGDYAVTAQAIGDWGNSPVRITSKTVSYTFSDRGYPQSVMAVNFDGCGSRTQWIYTYVS